MLRFIYIRIKVLWSWVQGLETPIFGDELMITSNMLLGTRESFAADSNENMRSDLMISSVSLSPTPGHIGKKANLLKITISCTTFH